MARKATGGKPGRPFHPELLTPAEQRVLEGVREGLHNAEIGVRLGISPDGVKFHVSNMLTKLNLSSREELAHWQAPRESALRRAWLAIPLAAKWAAGGVAAVAVAAGVAAFVLLGDSSNPVVNYPDGLVSVSSAGEPGNQDSFDPSISGDGRYVVFASGATNLVPDDTNQAPDIFLHDRLTGTTTRISMGFNGQQANAESLRPVISADGRYVAFESQATNLVDIAPNTDESALAALQSPGRVVAVPSNEALWGILARNNIYRYDVVRKRAELVSIADDGSAADLGSTGASISADGRFIAFDSIATNLVIGDANNAVGGLPTNDLYSGMGGEDVFVRDMESGTTTRVSVTNDGDEATGSSSGAAISGDGRLVAFISAAPNLSTPPSTPSSSPNADQTLRLFVRELATRTTRELLPAAALAPERINGYGRPAFSGDGQRLGVMVHSLVAPSAPGQSARQNSLWSFGVPGQTHSIPLELFGVGALPVTVAGNGSVAITAVSPSGLTFVDMSSGVLTPFVPHTKADSDSAPSWPTLSSDASSIAYETKVGGHLQIVAENR